MRAPKIAIALLVLYQAAPAQSILSHQAHFSNMQYALVGYGGCDSPSSLLPWIASRFDMDIGGACDPRTGANKIWWSRYVDMTFVYAAQMYAVQASAVKHNYVLEDMMLHASADMQYQNGYQWLNMHQFDAFEHISDPDGVQAQSSYWGAAVNGVFLYANSAYTDVTVNSFSRVGGGPTVITTIPSGGYLYVGYMEPFDQMNFTMATGRSGGSVSYQYWNGSNWSALAPRSDATNGLAASGKVYFYPPSDWAPTVVNGSQSKFWVRVAVSGVSVAPAYSALYGDDWTVSSGTNNARGWSTTDAHRINVGTRLEYNPAPPTGQSAKFRYQARVTGIWAQDGMIGNPTAQSGGTRMWGTYLADTALAEAAHNAAGCHSESGNALPCGDSVMFDDGASFPSTITAPTNAASLMDFNQSSGWQAEVVTEYTQVTSALHAAAPNFRVGVNSTLMPLILAGDWALNETEVWMYAFPAVYAFRSPWASYDDYLQSNNPTNVKGYIMYMDTPWLYDSNTNPAFTTAHYIDHANRQPILALAQHWIGTNSNTGFVYNPAGLSYNEIDAVYAYGPATTVTNDVAVNLAGTATTVTLASLTGCSPLPGSSNYLVRLGTPASGDTVLGTLSGKTLTTTSDIAWAHVNGSSAYCIQLNHLASSPTPPAGNVWRWGPWFPAMETDLGAPNTNGYRGGARAVTEPGNTPWKTGGAPDYVSGLPQSACDHPSPAYVTCSDLWRRDFANGIVLVRPFTNGGTVEAELDTPSHPIDLSGTYYPLQADGTTGTAVTHIQLRAGEGAILMTSPFAGVPNLTAPICSAGSQQTFRAGFPVRLDGSGSMPQDGGTGLSYLWQQLSGPTRVIWSNHSQMQPVIRGLVFGSYVFQLTVTDGSKQSSACTVKHGAVATDDNGVVITGSPVADALLGPMIRMGANPWPWFDDRNQAAANAQIAAMDTYYPAWWNAAGPGTVAIAGDSTAVTGTGTSFTTTFCQGPANPTVPKTNAMIAVWYATPGQTGQRMAAVTECTDDTHLSVDMSWDASLAGTGLGYAADDASTGYATNWGWGGADTWGNYNDNVAAYYALYYRSGIDDYLTAARKLADRFWQSPMIDQGRAPMSNCAGYGYTGGTVSAMGLVLRAMELEGTAADMWPGLHHVWDTLTGYLDGLDIGTRMWNTREEADHLATVSYCALSDPDASYRAKCGSAIADSLSRLWTPSGFPDGSWPQLYSSDASWNTSTNVTLTNGATAVTGNGTNWASSSFPATIWFTNDPSNAPSDNSGGDAVVYTAFFGDATHLTLDRPYTGATGTHGWALASSGSNAMVGWGTDPSTMGVLAAAFDFAAKALTTMDPTNSTVAAGYAIAAAHWIQTYGYWPKQKGMYAGAQSVNCQAPIAESNIACTGGNSVGRSRAASAEALRGLMAAYARTQDAGIRSFADGLYNAMFAKPGTCPAGSANCVADGYYIDGLDSGGSMISAAPPGGSEWFGTIFGFGNLAAWPATRIGGPEPSSLRTVYVGYNSASVRGSSTVQVVSTTPGGVPSQTACTASPCAVAFDGRQGNPLLVLKYLSKTGSVLATARVPID